MDMEVFAREICTALKGRLGDGHKVEVKETRKNNGVILHGLLVSSEGQAVVPAIYLETFLEAYESGAPFGDIVQKLLDICHEEALKGQMDMGFFRSFGQVRDRICCRLIGRKGNEGLLEEIPYVEFLDLAICFYYAYHGEEIGDGTILIYNSHMEMWDTCTAELFGLGRSNPPRLFPWTCRSLAEVMESLGQQEGMEGMEGMDLPLKVLSNDKYTYGAICMLYPGVVDGLAAEAGRSLYILPSSVHELILLPDSGGEPVEGLKDMVREVNRTQVAPEEVLSDSVYYYDIRKKMVSTK